MWVVKIGGSLNLDPHLPAWLRALAELGGGRVTVVPGGGRPADMAREAQAHWGFDDVAAHNMAVLAMAQSAMMLSAIEPRLVLGTHEADLRAALHVGRAAVWLPLNLVRHEPDELTTWDVTSDSLALWLARRLNAERLLIVKACPVDPAQSLATLSARGVLDARFATWADGAAFPIDIVQCNEVARVRQALLHGGSPLRPRVHPAGRGARRAAARERGRQAPHPGRPT